MVQLKESGPQIPKFFTGRSIFITGATGFLGKVLVERLLSTCPDVGRLYLLMRTKKDLAVDKRLQLLKQSQAFNSVRHRSPRQLDKLTAVSGDLMQPTFGLKADDLNRIKDVSIVIHAAATVKMNEWLGAAADSNLRPVFRLLDICDSLPNVLVFVYISTAYSNSELTRVEEKVYPPTVPLETLLAALDVEKFTDNRVKQFIAPKPNTYTFTKAMAEHVIATHPNKGYSSAIFRPSIVVSSLRYPYPGWIENLNGPVGVIVSTGKGLLRVMRCRGSAAGDLIPADIAIDTLLAVIRDTGIHKSPHVRVYNCSSVENPLTWHSFRSYINTHLRSHPLDDACWVPALRDVENRYLYKTLEVVLQTIPHYCIEYAKNLLGFKSRVDLIRANQKMLSMQDVLSFFALRQWHFDNANVVKLRLALSSDDRAIYNLDPNTIVWEDHLRDFVKGVRKFVLKEKDQDLPAARAHMNRLCMLDKVLKIFAIIYFVRFLLRTHFVRRKLFKY